MFVKNFSLKCDDLDKLYCNSPIDCYKLKIVALICVVLMLLSVTFNSILLSILFTRKEFCSPLNIIMIILSLFSLIGSLTELPIVIATNYACR
ncbi:unnamed protein product [Brachionus calyciflorus]|uniref:G-protein coupled receptors family 1 profile domain-containing protein n=1 Tax=Brachionus calyciflorus TaxID=104777 RepID=A0A814K345_9BILA|nr:unnamed protein product [Brachionus calyciflorus]